MPERSSDEIYDLAEQILMGRKTIEELSSLPEEDLERVKRIVARGPSALSERSEEVHLHKNQLRRKLKFKNCSTGYVYIRDLPHLNPVNLLKCIPFTPFPFSKIQSLPFPIRQGIISAWIGGMTPIEVGVLIQQLDRENGFLFIKEGNPRYGNEVEEIFSREQEEEEVSVDLEEILAKYSIITANYLKERKSLPDSFKEEVTKYWEGLRKELNEYCQELPGRMELDDQLRGLDDTQWRNLAGLTPRRVMAYLHEVIKGEYYEKLIAPLPVRQKEELKEEIHFLTKNEGNGLDHYSQLIQKLKQWHGIVIKVSHSGGSEA